MKTLKQHRVEKMMTGRELAADALISRSTLWRIEHEGVHPHFGTMLSIAQALGVDVREIAEFDAVLISKMAEAA